MIIFFSGTGNSLHVANLLGEHLGDVRVRLTGRTQTVVPDSAGRIIWVFPVYSWGVPPVVKRWMQTLEIPGASEAVHHCVMTCGDDVGQADMMWRRLMAARGWRAAGAYSVQMPNTYVLMKGFDVDSPSFEKKKIEESTGRVARIAARISENKTAEPECDVVRGGFAWIKSHIIYPWFVRFDMSPRPFRFADNCIGCGKCAGVCPMDNIRMVEQRPMWGTDCALCLGCYHICPQHAVQYGNITKLKGQKKVLLH